MLALSCRLCTYAQDNIFRALAALFFLRAIDLLCWFYIDSIGYDGYLFLFYLLGMRPKATPIFQLRNHCDCKRPQ
eukprot:2780018-Amphidinium_carterae.1